MEDVRFARLDLTKEPTNRFTVIERDLFLDEFPSMHRIAYIDHVPLAHLTSLA